MENISIENSFEVKTICDSFLYSCITPAFIWAVQDKKDKALKIAELGQRLITEKKKELDELIYKIKNE